MLLGQKMPGEVAGWRFVEKDLHDIASRVTEYDSDARLVREDGTGHLGLARWMPSWGKIAGGYWFLARVIHDLDTDKPLVGEPDGRVMRFMRAADNRGRDLTDWARRSQHAAWMREKREHDAISDVNMDHAERFVKALEKDVSHRPRAYIPRAIPKAA